MSTDDDQKVAPTEKKDVPPVANEPQGPNPDAEPVTMGFLDLYMAKVMEFHEKRQQEQRNREFESLMSGIDDRFNNIFNRLQDIETVLIAAAKQEQAARAPGPGPHVVQPQTEIPPQARGGVPQQVQQPQQVQYYQQEPQQQKKLMGGMTLSQAREEAAGIITLLQEVGLINKPTPSENDRLIGLVKRGLQRQEDRYLLRIINGLRKRGDLGTDEVAEVVSEKIAESRGHDFV